MTTTYKITIKNNSIPEHMQKAIPNYHDTYTAIMKIEKLFNVFTLSITFCDELSDYIRAMAMELNTDPESLEILSIIKQ